jgi:hypothetical protein
VVFTQQHAGDEVGIGEGHGGLFGRAISFQLACNEKRDANEQRNQPDGPRTFKSMSDGQKENYKCQTDTAKDQAVKQIIARLFCFLRRRQ